MSHPHKDRNKLIVIMLDGCRHDYFKRDSKNHPGFRFIKENGVVADYVQPIFPSNSFQFMDNNFYRYFNDLRGRGFD